MIKAAMDFGLPMSKGAGLWDLDFKHQGLNGSLKARDGINVKRKDIQLNYIPLNDENPNKIDT